MRLDIRVILDLLAKSDDPKALLGVQFKLFTLQIENRSLFWLELFGPISVRVLGIR